MVLHHGMYNFIVFFFSNQKMLEKIGILLDFFCRRGLALAKHCLSCICIYYKSLLTPLNVTPKPKKK